MESERNPKMYSFVLDEDAAGKPIGGLLFGNVFWLGSYSECQAIPSSHYCLLRLNFTPPNAVSTQ